MAASDDTVTTLRHSDAGVTSHGTIMSPLLLDAVASPVLNAPSICKINVGNLPFAQAR